MQTTSDSRDGRDAELNGASPASRSLDFDAQRIREQVRTIHHRVNERTGRNLALAIAISLLMIAALLLSLLIDKRFFLPLGMGLCSAVVLELTTAMRRVGRQVPRIPSVVFSLVIVPIAYFYPPSVFWLTFLVGLACVVGWRVVDGLLVRRNLLSSESKRRQLAVDASSTAFTHFYVTFLSTFTIVLLAQPRGELWVLSYIGVVIAVDTGAYASGLKWGKTKLAPRISPSKTWEGMLGGAALAIVVALAASIWLLDLPWWFGIVMGVALTLTAVCGDLTESMIKRDLGVKDMSNWLPGHGGFFDRVDSVIPSGAMAFALYFWAAPMMEFAQRLG